MADPVNPRLGAKELLADILRHNPGLAAEDEWSAVDAEGNMLAGSAVLRPLAPGIAHALGHAAVNFRAAGDGRLAGRC